MSGLSNFEKYLRGKIISISKGYTFGKLYHLKSYNCPALVDGEDKIVGEILELGNDVVIDEIDLLEMNFFNTQGPSYLREKRKVFYDSGRIELIDVYIYKQKIDEKTSIYIPSGDWKEFLKNNE